MKHNEVIYDYEPLWGTWKVEKLIGVGSIGKVYKVYREEYGRQFFSAVKVISIPTSEQISIFNSMAHSGDEKIIGKYLDDIVKNLMNEIDMLYELKGTSNIISYEDHLIEKVPDKNEWHIFIRMEYAISLKDYLVKNTFNKSDIYKLTIDMCNALEVCHSNKILHRDIKEENIFVTKKGIYKLGDLVFLKLYLINHMLKLKLEQLIICRQK